MILELILEAILYLFGEILFAIVWEVIGRLVGLFAFSRLPAALDRQRNVVAFRAVLLGLILGAVSLLIVSHPILKEPALQYVNLLISPLFVGIWSLLIRENQIKRDKQATELDSFGFGFTFAFVFALVRLTWFHL